MVFFDVSWQMNQHQSWGWWYRMGSPLGRNDPKNLKPSNRNSAPIQLVSATFGRAVPKKSKPLARVSQNLLLAVVWQGSEKDSTSTYLKMRKITSFFGNSENKREVVPMQATPSLLSCEFCDKKFQGTQGLGSHIKNKHNTEATRQKRAGRSRFRKSP